MKQKKPIRVGDQVMFDGLAVEVSTEQMRQAEMCGSTYWTVKHWAFSSFQISKPGSLLYVITRRQVTHVRRKKKIEKMKIVGSERFILLLSDSCYPMVKNSIEAAALYVKNHSILGAEILELAPIARHKVRE